MITARWTSLAEAKRNAAALGAELASEKVLAPALLSLGRAMQEDIERTAPRDDTAPHMADDFTTRVSTEDKAEGRTTVLVGPHPPRSSASNGAGFRAAFHEFGTAKMAARPFIRPAFDRLRASYPAALAAELRVQFDRVVKRYAARASR